MRRPFQLYSLLLTLGHPWGVSRQGATQLSRFSGGA